MGALDRVFRGRRGGQVRPLAAQVAALFANGEQGLWYDIEAFRDAWNNLGPERLTNGSFDDGLNGWTVTQPSGSTISASSGAISFGTDGGSYAAVSQAIGLTIGAWYAVTLEGVSGSGSLKVVGIDTEVTFTSARTFVGRATATSFSIARVAGAAASMSIGRVSVKEWLGSQSCTLFQDSSGSIPAYAPGQGQADPPIGLVLDRRLGLVRGANRFNDAAVLLSGESARISPGVYRCYSSAGVYNLVNFGGALTIGKWYELTFTVDSVAVAGTGLSFEGVDITQVALAVATVGIKRCIFRASASYIGIKRNSSPIDLQVSGVSICELSGNHAWQATTASRPVLSARYNLLTATEQFDSTAWAKIECTVAADAAVGPNGGNADKVIPSTNAAGHYVSQTVTSGSDARTMRVVAKPAGCDKVTLYPGGSATFAHFDLTAGTTSREANVTASSITALGGGWYECIATWAAGVTATTARVYASSGTVGAAAVAGDGVAGVLLERADMRSANDGVGLPEYQRVVDATTYDTAGFPLYLKFDGVDDGLLTGSIDLSAYDKALLCIAAQKQADVNCVLVEFGNSFSADGAFGAQLPNAGGSFLAAWGTGTSVYRVVTLPPAPASGVFSAYLDRSKVAAVDALVLRLNGAAAGGPGVGSPVAGTWGNNTLYIGRRTNSTLPFKGRLYGLLIRAGAINDGQIQKVERFLNQKAKVF